MFACIIDDQIKLLKTRGESDGGNLRLLALSPRRKATSVVREALVRP
jgi:hypothetical protein